MKLKTQFVTLCFVFLIINGCSKNVPKGYTAPGGEFSFVPPERWEMRQVPGFKYQFAFGPMVNQFSPNINFVDQAVPAKLDEYVTFNLQALQQMATTERRSFKILSQGEFTTDSKRSGARVVTETDYEGNPVMQTFYFFEGKNDIKFVITCTVPAEGGDYEKVCDSSMRTFKTNRDS